MMNNYDNNTANHAAIQKTAPELLVPLIQADLFVLAHSEDNNKLYGVMLDGVFATEKRAREVIKMLCSSDDKSTTYFIYKCTIQQHGYRIIFKGKRHEA
jgi:hypothetical protein